MRRKKVVDSQEENSARRDYAAGCAEDHNLAQIHSHRNREVPSASGAQESQLYWLQRVG